MHSNNALTMTKLVSYSEKKIMPKCDSSNKNETLQVLDWESECKDPWKGGNIKKDFTTRTVGLAFKWVFKVSPTKLGRLNGGALCPFSGHPSHLTMWLHAVFVVNKSLTKSTWMCLGSKPLGRYFLCTPNQNK
jgi:hypothetical protein